MAVSEDSTLFCPVVMKPAYRDNSNRMFSINMKKKEDCLRVTTVKDFRCCAKSTALRISEFKKEGRGKRGGQKVEFSSVWATINLGPTCSDCGFYFISASVPTDKEWRIMKDQLQNSRLKDDTEEERFRVQERR